MKHSPLFGYTGSPPPVVQPPMSSYRGAGWLAHNSVHANDYTFFQEIDQFKQEEPVEALEPELRGLLASIGIKKGRLHRCVGMLYVAPSHPA